MKRLKKTGAVIIALLLVLYLGLVVVAFLPQETIPVSQLAGRRINLSLSTARLFITCRREAASRSF